MFESLKCDTCRETCEVIYVPYPVITILSWVELLIFAVFFLMYNDISATLKISLGVVAIVIFFILGSVGVSHLKKRGGLIGKEGK